MNTLAPWARRIIKEYESGSTGCFILHGNINDQFVMPSEKGARLGRLQDFIADVLLAQFDVILTYDIGYGIKAEKGADLFEAWPEREQSLLSSGVVLPAVRSISHYLLSVRKLAAAGEKAPKVAVIIKQAHLVVPAIPHALNYELNALASVLRSWASDIALQNHGQAAFILTNQLPHLHPLVTENPRVSAINIPLPEAWELEEALRLFQPETSEALAHFGENLAAPAQRLKGASISAVEHLLRERHYMKEPLRSEDLTQLKKELVEQECGELIEFLEPHRTLHDYLGMERVVEWLRQDLALWAEGHVQALPMGYLFCGPVGTGKTYLAQCLAGEAGVPVVVMRNFRDRWIGSTEANLEKIFALLTALGRCIVFIDEADQTLGQRPSNSSDSGVSSRVYSMIAQKMSDTRNRGKILWILASSRPDLIEVDLKRPGRLDVKIPIFPVTDPAEGLALLLAFCLRRGLSLDGEPDSELLALIPEWLTPGAAEALSVKAYRMVVLGKGSLRQVLIQTLQEYSPATSPEVIFHQMKLAAQEATEKQFIPWQIREQLAPSTPSTPPAPFTPLAPASPLTYITQQYPPLPS